MEYSWNNVCSPIKSEWKVNKSHYFNDIEINVKILKSINRKKSKEKKR